MVRNGSRLEGKDCRPSDLENLQFSAPATGSTFSPSFGGNPKMCFTGYSPLGATTPHVGHRSLARRMLESGSRVSLPRLGSISHCRAPSPFHPPSLRAASQPISAPLSRLAAPQRGSGVSPGLCSSCNWEKAPKYLHAQLEMHTYTQRHGSPEVPALRGSLL